MCSQSSPPFSLILSILSRRMESWSTVIPWSRHLVSTRHSPRCSSPPPWSSHTMWPHPWSHRPAPSAPHTRQLVRRSSGQNTRGASDRMISRGEMSLEATRPLSPSLIKDIKNSHFHNKALSTFSLRVTFSVGLCLNVAIVLCTL